MNWALRPRWWVNPVVPSHPGAGRRTYLVHREDRGAGLFAEDKPLERKRETMSDKQKSPQSTPESAQDNRKGMGRQNQQMSDRDEAPPGTPGTGENIDPKTGEKFIEGIGGA